MSGMLTDIPSGKCRVVGINPESATDFKVGDYEPDKAYQIADEHNGKREGPLATIYYVYDGDGSLVRAQGAVPQPYM